MEKSNGRANQEVGGGQLVATGSSSRKACSMQARERSIVGTFACHDPSMARCSCPSMVGGRMRGPTENV